MALPILPVTLPSALAGQSNGRLPANRLVAVPGQDQGATVTLVAVAAGSWVAMCAAARTAGYLFKATGSGDSYRSYAAQEALFRARYTTTNTGRDSKTWNGTRYWLRAGLASAAVPGTSNHGWGLAVDVAVELDGDPGPESITDDAVDWLVAHAATYGWSAELQSEPWHWRYVAGDTIPAAVTAHEAQQSTEEDDVKIYVFWCANRLIASIPGIVCRHVRTEEGADALAKFMGVKDWKGAPQHKPEELEGFGIELPPVDQWPVGAGAGGLAPHTHDLPGTTGAVAS